MPPVYRQISSSDSYKQHTGLEGDVTVLHCTAMHAAASQAVVVVERVPMGGLTG